MFELSELCVTAGWTLHRDSPVSSFGFVETPIQGRLVFVMDGKYLERLRSMEGVGAVLTTPDLASAAQELGLGVASTDDPRRAFFLTHNRLVDELDAYGPWRSTIVEPSARVHSAAHVDPVGVVIGSGCRIDPGAVLGQGTELGEDVHVMSGAVLGSTGFQTIRVPDATIDLRHGGRLVIGDRSVVMANAVIARAVFRNATVIGPDCRIGNTAFISHNCQVGPNTLIGHGSVLAGNCRVGARVTIGPGAVCVDRLEIGDDAVVTAGAVVIRSVAAGTRVSGNFATGHRQAMRTFAAGMPAGSRKRR